MLLDSKDGMPTVEMWIKITFNRNAFQLDLKEE